MERRPAARGAFGAAGADRRRFSRIGRPRPVRFAPYPACTPSSQAVLGGFSLWGGCLALGGAAPFPIPSVGDILLVEPSREAGALPGSAMAVRVRWIRQAKRRRVEVGIQFLPLSSAARETLLRWMKGR